MSDGEWGRGMTEAQNKNWQAACEMVGVRLVYVRKIAAALNAKDAAAADMLEALKVIADWDKAPLTHEHPGPLLDVIRCICDRAREEIRKATTP